MTVTTDNSRHLGVDDQGSVSPVNTPYLGQWVTAGKLVKGEHLKTTDGTLAVADGGTTPKVHDGWMWDLTVPGNNDHDFYVEPATVLPSTRVGPAVAVLVHNSSCRFSVDSAGTVTDNQGPAGIVLNKASGDGFRDTVASFLRSQGRTVTTDADNRSALTFQALGKPRILDMMVQDDSGSTLGYIETKYGAAASMRDHSNSSRMSGSAETWASPIDVVSGR